MVKIDEADFQAQIAGAIGIFRKFSVEAVTEYEKALNTSALVVEGDAKKLSPVDTGRLRASITHRLGKDAKGAFAEVGSNVDYSAAQELGTSKMPAHPFLTPALEANKQKIKDFLARALNKAAEDAGR